MQPYLRPQRPENYLGELLSHVSSSSPPLTPKEQVASEAPSPAAGLGSPPLRVNKYKEMRSLPAFFYTRNGPAAVAEAVFAEKAKNRVASPFTLLKAGALLDQTAPDAGSVLLSPEERRGHRLAAIYELKQRAEAGWETTLLNSGASERLVQLITECIGEEGVDVEVAADAATVLLLLCRSQQRDPETFPFDPYDQALPAIARVLSAAEGDYCHCLTRLSSAALFIATCLQCSEAMCVEAAPLLLDALIKAAPEQPTFDVLSTLSSALAAAVRERPLAATACLDERAVERMLEALKNVSGRENMSSVAADLAGLLGELVFAAPSIEAAPLNALLQSLGALFDKHQSFAVASAVCRTISTLSSLGMLSEVHVDSVGLIVYLVSGALPGIVSVAVHEQSRAARPPEPFAFPKPSERLVIRAQRPDALAFVHEAGRALALLAEDDTVNGAQQRSRSIFILSAMLALHSSTPVSTSCLSDESMLTCPSSRLDATTSLSTLACALVRHLGGASAQDVACCNCIESLHTLVNCGRFDVVSALLVTRPVISSTIARHVTLASLVDAGALRSNAGLFVMAAALRTGHHQKREAAVQLLAAGALADLERILPKASAPVDLAAGAYILAFVTKHGAVRRLVNPQWKLANTVASAEKATNDVEVAALRAPIFNSLIDGLQMHFHDPQAAKYCCRALATLRVRVFVSSDVDAGSRVAKGVFSALSSHRATLRVEKDIARLMKKVSKAQGFRHGVTPERRRLLGDVVTSRRQSTEKAAVKIYSDFRTAQRRLK